MGFSERKRLCPDDGQLMQKTEVDGVVIDMCACEVVVLGPGELPALIGHLASRPNFNPKPQLAQNYYAGHGAYAHASAQHHYAGSHSSHSDHGHRSHGGHGHHGHGQKSFLDELFD